MPSLTSAVSALRPPSRRLLREGSDGGPHGRPNNGEDENHCCTLFEICGERQGLFDKRNMKGRHPP